MMKHVMMVATMVALGGCSTVNTTMTEWSNELTSASWMQKDYWLGSKTMTNAAVEPAAGKPAAVKMEATLAPVKTPEVKGDRMLRIAGNTPTIAKDGAFEAARTTCAKEEPQQQAHVARDKAGEANGSFFHDVEFDCV